MNRKPLQFVLLAGLEVSPRSGYELTQWLARLGGHFWSAEHSSIYPALAQLEKDGLIQHKEAPGQKGQTRKIYALTPAGRNELTAWVDTPSLEPEIRDEQMVKILCFDLLPKESRKAHLERIRQMHILRLEQYQELLRNHIAGTIAVERQEYSGRLGPQLTLRRGILAAQAYIDWCDEALQIV